MERESIREAEVPGSASGEPVGVNGVSLLGLLLFSPTPAAWSDLRLPCQRREAVLLAVCSADAMIFGSSASRLPPLPLGWQLFERIL